MYFVLIANAIFANTILIAIVPYYCVAAFACVGVIGDDTDDVGLEFIAAVSFMYFSTYNKKQPIIQKIFNFIPRITVLNKINI